MPNPYAKLVSDEVSRAEADLAGFRSRALTVITTSAGLVTVLTAVVAFAASKSEEERGVPGEAVAASGLALVFFVAAAALALLANLPKDVDAPDPEVLLRRTDKDQWEGDPGDTESELERVATRTLVPYMVSVRRVAHDASNSLAGAIAFQVLGLIAVSVAAMITMVAL